MINKEKEGWNYRMGSNFKGAHMESIIDNLFSMDELQND
jgi:hypothetical protein